MPTATAQSKYPPPSPSTSHGWAPRFRISNASPLWESDSAGSTSGPCSCNLPNVLMIIEMSSKRGTAAAGGGDGETHPSLPLLALLPSRERRRGSPNDCNCAKTTPARFLGSDALAISAWEAAASP